MRERGHEGLHFASPHPRIPASPYPRIPVSPHSRPPRPYRRFPVHADHRRVARILALLLQAAASAGSYVDYVSPIHRLWKYVVLGLTSIVFEEANPIFGGIAARNGRLGLIGVITAVAIGTWVPSIAFYFVGRWRVDWVRARWPDRQRLLDGALEIVRRHPWRASLAIRFAYGLRLPVPIACGAARLPLVLYVLASGISCWLWSALFVFLGWKAGGAALAFLGFTSRYDVRLGFIAIVLIATLFFMRRRRRIAERTAHVLSGEDIKLTETTEMPAVKRKSRYKKHLK
jgi:membrane protein DedA with SNARE-associated domain